MTWEAQTRFHRQQPRPNGCVAACLAMAECRRQTGDEALSARLEAEYVARLAPYGVDGLVELRDAAHALGFEYTYDGEPAPDFIHLLATVLAERWAVITLRAPQAESAICVQHPGVDFVSLGSRQHAVVLIGVEGASIVYLDPFYPKRYQPVRMPWRVFADAWSWGIVWV